MLVPKGTTIFWGWQTSKLELLFEIELIRATSSRKIENFNAQVKGDRFLEMY